jgi:hypothetical protein
MDQRREYLAADAQPKCRLQPSEEGEGAEQRKCRTITFVASRPSELNLGLVATRARNPYAITAVSNGTCRAIAAELTTRTPAATTRAAPSLTGSGNDSNVFMLYV